MATHHLQKSKAGELLKLREREESIRTYNSQFDLLKKVSKQKSSSKFKESFLAETFERLRTRRLTVRMTEAVCSRQKPIATLHFREELGGVSYLRWSPEGDCLAIGFYSGDIKICSRCRLTGRPTETVSLVKGWEGNYPVTCLKFHPRHPELLYAASLAGTLSTTPRRPLPADHLTVITEEGNEINSFDFSCDGSALVTVGKDAMVRVYDADTHKLTLLFSRHRWSESTMATVLSSLSEESHVKRVFCVKGHPEQPWLFLTGGWDRIVKVWDTRVKEGCVKNILGPYIFGECIDIHGGRGLLTAQTNKPCNFKAISKFPYD